MTEASFKISIPDEKLELLRKKLELTALPDELEDSGWKYGVPLGDIRRLVARWKDGFDWRAQEAILNAELPQFTRDIQVDGHGTLNIHYVHQKSQVVDAIPLLFIHGCTFHVVALSLPGYGFSQATKKQGFKTGQHAEVGNKLMISLGYDKYVTQGGDWGAIITRKLSSVYGGAHSQAWHTNMPRVRPPTIYEPLLYLRHMLTPYTETEKVGLQRTKWFENQGRGYHSQHSTQPQTIGYSLADSPVGLLSWIYEKLVNWSDSYPWDDDEVLTWVSIYWFSREGPTASIRLYYEYVQSGDRVLTKEPTIPLGLSYFPKEVRSYPRLWSRAEGNLVFESEHTSGGHFAAHEKPHELVDDLRKMFGKDGPAFGVVPGRIGYV
ncbi:Alpha/Beta hydrolase protein [Desarmillaria tabescens]|uniref:Alpha/Beta hydrolase protein n=1 Tax=Armillaria tabescens TaxID=1929756 RepID=A0AA39NFJ7_ARMTA|nr:Alpha/Beta hydrolase protein [Desarmillaria tabescens]KAK0464725.1 Alpha/Beta hydrolase protein [Desarmillaria tabescens]